MLVVSRYRLICLVLVLLGLFLSCLFFVCFLSGSYYNHCRLTEKYNLSHISSYHLQSFIFLSKAVLTLHNLKISLVIVGFTSRLTIFPLYMGRNIDMEAP